MPNMAVNHNLGHDTRRINTHSAVPDESHDELHGQGIVNFDHAAVAGGQQERYAFKVLSLKFAQALDVGWPEAV